MIRESRPRANWAERLDAAMLALLILTMCSQLDVRTIGRNTLAEGYATKQLFIAFSDVALVLAFGWFVARTTALRAWRRLWWPPPPCWALLAAMLIAALHSQQVTSAVADALGKAHGLKGVVKAIAAKESKEAIAEMLQFAAYFVAAPLLFVNLIHDRRADGRTVVRRRFAIGVFTLATLIVTGCAAYQMIVLKRAAPFAFFGMPNGSTGSSNVYSGFLAMSLPLLVARVIHRRGGWGHPGWYEAFVIPLMTYAALILGLLTMVSPWAAGALFIGVVIAGSMLRVPGRAIVVLGVMALAAFYAWSTPSPAQRSRTEFLRVPSATEKVKKQYIEWYAALGWAAPRLRQFATGVGPGNYQFNIGSYYSFLPNEEKMPPDSNNLYLVQAVSLGVLGLGALLWVLGHFAREAHLAHRAPPWDWLGAGVLSSLVAFACVNVFHALIVRGTGIVLAFLLSLAVIARQRRARAGDS
jgi:hypothetical protein